MNARWILLLVMALLSGCSDEPRPLPEGSIQDRIKYISSRVTSVEEPVKGELILIEHFQPTIWSGRSWTWNFLSDAFSIMKKMPEITKGAPYKKVTFMVRIPTRDNLGKEGSALGMKVRYDLATLAGAQWSSMTPFDIGEISEEVVMTRLGMEAVAEYCKENDHTSVNRKLCARAMR